MKRRVMLLLCSTVLCLISYAQKKKTKYAPINFTKYAWNMSVNREGTVQGEVSLDDLGNKSGNARIYLVHKNGGNWWYKEAKKKLPNFYANYLLVNSEFRDTSILDDYNKWAFFVDKKHLKGQPNYGDDFFQLDKDENSYLPSEAEIQKIKEKLDYYEKPNITLEIILYEQKAGSKQWVEIDRRKYRTDQEGNRIYPKGEHWESDFIDQKLKESNTHSPRR